MRDAEGVLRVRPALHVAEPVLDHEGTDQVFVCRRAGIAGEDRVLAEQVPGARVIRACRDDGLQLLCGAVELAFVPIGLGERTRASRSFG